MEQAGDCKAKALWLSTVASGDANALFVIGKTSNRFSRNEPCVGLLVEREPLVDSRLHESIPAYRRVDTVPRRPIRSLLLLRAKRRVSTPGHTFLPDQAAVVAPVAADHPGTPRDPRIDPWGAGDLRAARVRDFWRPGRAESTATV